MNFKINNILIFLIFIASTLLLSAYETVCPFNSINDVINQSQISKNSIVSVSVREVQSGKIVFQRDANLLLHPASTLKALTMPVILDVLGADYKVSTGIYKDSKGNVYLKLSGDPMLNADKLSELFKNFASKGNNKIKGKIFIDDTAIDDIPWGIGWMWDDENNTYMPKISAYNLNHNLITVKVSPTKFNQTPNVEIFPFYPVKIINNAITTNEDNLSVERKVWKDLETIYISGKVSMAAEKLLPIGIPENFFKYQLINAIKSNKIKFSGEIAQAKLPDNAVLISEISNNLVDELKTTIKQSDNLAAESLFKLAGAEYTGLEGSTVNGLKAFNNFYSKLGLNTSEISIVDASGVSHNDLITANWMTLALIKLYENNDYETYKSILAVPTESGTLQNRLGDLKGKLYAKTGTNAGISAITGYLVDRAGKTYAFSIIIQNYIGSSKPAKELEDIILRHLSNN